MFLPEAENQIELPHTIQKSLTDSHSSSQHLLKSPGGKKKMTSAGGRLLLRLKTPHNDALQNIPHRTILKS